MVESCPVLTSSEREVVEIIKRGDDALAAAVSRALQDVTEKAAKDMQAAGQDEAAPALQYFASVVHQRMYCLMCGANPDTFEGGDPDIAYHVIRNSQNIAKHYWMADLEPYPPK